MMLMVNTITMVQLISVGRLTSRPAIANRRFWSASTTPEIAVAEVVQERLYTAEIERQLETVEGDRPHILKYPLQELKDCERANGLTRATHDREYYC
jgi:hypothetical protein